MSQNTSSAAKEQPVENSLTDAATAAPACDRRSNRRSFTDAEKLAIVMEAEQPGVSAAETDGWHRVDATESLSIPAHDINQFTIRVAPRRRTVVQLFDRRFRIGPKQPLDHRIELGPLRSTGRRISASNRHSAGMIRDPPLPIERSMPGDARSRASATDRGILTGTWVTASRSPMRRQAILVALGLLWV